MEVKPRVRAVKCPNCRAYIDYMDSERSRKFVPENAVLMQVLISDPGTIACPHCGKEHTYKGQDVEVIRHASPNVAVNS